MTRSKHHLLTAKHLLVCLAVIAVAVTTLLAGAGPDFLLAALLCSVMMGAMMWMMLGGMNGRGGDRS